MIHPTAIVDPGARIGRNVSIGAYSVIGAAVEIGEECWIGPHVVISGPTRIGRGNKIFQFCSLGEPPQHLGYKGEETLLEIGEANVIREYCTMNRATAEGGGVTRLGNGNFIMAYCHLAHDCQVGNHTIFANCASLAGHVTIGDYAILGGFTVVHQHCRIGAHSITALGTVTFKDIPPYVTAAGNAAAPHGINARGLKRRRFAPQTIEAIRRAYKTVYKSDLLLQDALAALEGVGREHAEIAEFSRFIKASERGIIR